MRRTWHLWQYGTVQLGSFNLIIDKEKDPIADLTRSLLYIAAYTSINVAGTQTCKIKYSLYFNIKSGRGCRTTVSMNNPPHCQSFKKNDCTVNYLRPHTHSLFHNAFRLQVIQLIQSNMVSRHLVKWFPSQTAEISHHWRGQVLHFLSPTARGAASQGDSRWYTQPPSAARWNSPSSDSPSLALVKTMRSWSLLVWPCQNSIR